MHNFSKTIAVKEPVSMTASNWALVKFDFIFKRQTKLYFVYDIMSGKNSMTVHYPKYNFSENRCAEVHAKNGFDLKREKLVSPVFTSLQALRFFHPDK